VSDTRSNVVKDVHTEHCCAKHGCKYGSWQGKGPCSVEDGSKPQSYMCEYCADWLEENWELIQFMREVYDAGRRFGQAEGLRQGYADGRQKGFSLGRRWVMP
jgi:hypothetical protein